MRTTINIDEDVLEVAKELARREKRTAGEVISDLARKGIHAGTAPAGGKTRNGVPLLPRRGEAITPAHVQRLMDEEGI